MSENLFEVPQIEERCNIQPVWSTIRITPIACIDLRQEELTQVLQERYGWSREEAVSELDRRLRMYARMRLG